MSCVRQLFGYLGDGSAVHSILLKHESSGFAVQILEYGATLQAIYVPDRQGRLLNTILSYDSLTEYQADKVYSGAAIGRCASRIANGSFQMEGQRFQLTRNEGPHHLHGGAGGFSKALWRTVELRDEGAPSVTLEHHSPDGEEGYPGNVTARLVVQITSPLSFSVHMSATVDRTTPLNFTLHPYFNLNGDPSSPIDNHELRIDADSILPTSADGIPTGDRLAVKDTPFDFSARANIGAGLARRHPQQNLRGGYDHYYVLNKQTAIEAELFSPASGVRLQMSTNQAGLQFYSGHFLRDNTGSLLQNRAGLCLEPHGFPNAVNTPAFPSVLADPQKEYQHTTRLAFAVVK